MAGSLKVFIPGLAFLLQMKGDALYERQRELVRAGLLRAKKGRGPGSGVQTSPYSVAVLLIAVLSTDNWSDTVALCSSISKAAPRRRARCPITNKRSFLDALTHVLADASIAKNVRAVTVDRASRTATIQHGNAGGAVLSEFGKLPKTAPNLAISATLTGAAIGILSALLTEENPAKEDSGS
jgi:hypothetical protein